MLKSTEEEHSVDFNSETCEEDHKLVTRKGGGQVRPEFQQQLGNFVFNVRPLYFHLF